MLKRTSTAAKRRRLDDLRRMLEGRRAQLAHDVQDRIRGARSDGLGDRDVVDFASMAAVANVFRVASTAARATSSEPSSPTSGCRSACSP